MLPGWGAFLSDDQIGWIFLCSTVVILIVKDI